jgi:FkbM family methyltransferase
MFRDHAVAKLLKRLRATQPLNFVGTSTLRELLRVMRLKPDFFAAHFPRVGTVEHTLPDGRRLRLWSLGDDWTANAVFWHGLTWEGDTLPTFLSLAARARTVMDVGAHVGLYTVLAAITNPNASVYAFEPHPSVRARLLKNVRLNSLSNVRCLDLALDHEAGQADFFVADAVSVPSSSGFAQGFLSGLGSPFKAIRVQRTTLDQFVAENGIKDIDLIKVDTETTEPRVLRGAIKTLARYRPDVICEVLPGADTGTEIQHVLIDLPYRFFLLTPEGPVSVSALSGDARYRNYLLTCREEMDPTGLFGSR